MSDIRALLRSIEEIRRTRVLLLAAQQLDITLLSPLYDLLEDVEPDADIDVVLYCKGGVPSGVRRLGLLLRARARRLTFIVPGHCESAGTILVLAGDAILASEAACFSPVDPLLSGQGEDGDGAIVSAEDVRLFREMAESWFGCPPDSGEAMLRILTESMLPTSLTSIYRSSLELAAICQELLTGRIGSVQAEQDRIVAKLSRGFFSHGYSLSGRDLGTAGLTMIGDARVERLSRSIAKAVEQRLGRAARTEETPWHDALIATSDVLQQRRRSPGRALGEWVEEGAG